MLTGPGDRLIVQHVLNCADDIADRDPGPPLSAAAQPAAQTHAEWRKHFRQGAAIRAHHHSKAHLRGPNSRLGCGLGGCLPLAADFGGESLARRAILAQDLVAAIAVVTDRGSRNENSRALRALWPLLPPDVPCPGCGCRGCAASWPPSSGRRWFLRPGESRASKPETTSGDRGRDGSHTIWSFPAAASKREPGA